MQDAAEMDGFIFSVKLIDADKKIIKCGQRMGAKIVMGHKTHSGNEPRRYIHRCLRRTENGRTAVSLPEKSTSP